MRRTLLAVCISGLGLAGLACTSEPRTGGSGGGASAPPGSGGSAGGAGGVLQTSGGSGGSLAAGGGTAAHATAGTGGEPRLASGGSGSVTPAGGAGSWGSSSGGGIMGGNGGGSGSSTAGSEPDGGIKDASTSKTDGGIASALDGFRVEMPCGTLQEADQVCTVAAKYDKQTFTLAFGGDAGTVYDVKLRVRGVVEPLTYTGGAAMPAIDPHYYVGGKPQNEWYRIWSIKTSAPSQVHYFNANPTVGHIILPIDYTVTIPMSGSSTVTVVSDGQGGNSIANFTKATVSGVPITQPYNGQFLQFDVVSATPK